MKKTTTITKLCLDPKWVVNGKDDNFVCEKCGEVYSIDHISAVGERLKAIFESISRVANLSDKY